MKKLKVNIALLLIIILFTTSCKYDNYKNANGPKFEIDIRSAIQKKNKDIKLTEIGESIRYIPLETIENKILRRIQKVLLHQDYIFVTDRQSVFQFSEDGRFIRQVGKAGKGPGEHSNRISFTLNPARSEVLIFSSGTNQLNFYDINSGKFKHSKDLGFDSFDIEMISDENLAFLTYELRAGFSLNSLVEIFIVNSMGEIVDSIMNYDRKNYKGNSAGFPIHYNYNNTINYIYNYRDTVYQIMSDLSKRPLMHMGFENSLAGDELAIKPDPNEIQFPDHLMIQNILENENYFFISVYEGIDLSFSGNNIHHLVYNKNNSSVALVESFINTLDNGPDFWPQWIVNGKLISYYQAHEILEYYGDIEEEQDFLSPKKDLLDGLNEYNNPVLVIVD